MAFIETHSRYVAFTPDRLESSRNFMNKIWNASRFALLHLEGYERPNSRPEPDFADCWIISRLDAAVTQVNEALGGYRFGEAAQVIYDFVWHEFCDWYLELIKTRLYSQGPRRDQARYYLLTVLEEILRLLHPFVPFISEEIWSQLPGPRDFLMRAPWPVPAPMRRDPLAESDMQVIQAVIYAVRNIRGEMNVPPGQNVPLLVRPLEGEGAVLERHQAMVRELAKISELTLGANVPKPKLAATAVAAGFELLVPLENLIDLGKERERLRKEIANLEALLEKQASKLSNPAFTAKAPAQVVDAERAKEADYKQRREQLKANLQRLGTK
jgi:valyl-tRNA synthetase